MKNLIGKEYTPLDNSWSVNVTQCGDFLGSAKRGYLAGSYYSEAKKCLIVSEPFECIVNTTGVPRPKQIKTMIIVEYDKETHMVLFFDKCVTL